MNGNTALRPRRRCAIRSLFAAGAAHDYESTHRWMRVRRRALSPRLGTFRCGILSLHDLPAIGGCTGGRFRDRAACRPRPRRGRTAATPVVGFRGTLVLRRLRDATRHACRSPARHHRFHDRLAGCACIRSARISSLLRRKNCLVSDSRYVSAARRLPSRHTRHLEGCVAPQFRRRGKLGQARPVVRVGAVWMRSGPFC